MKTMLLKIVMLATIISFVSFQSKAQAAPQIKTEEEKSQDQEAIKNLMQFLGKWQADVSYTLDGKKYTLQYWVEGHKTANGHGIYADEGFTSPELGTMNGGNLVGYDPFDAKIKWFSVDNMGTTHLHVGEWLSPNHLFIEHNGMRNGRNYVEKIDFVFKSKEDMSLTLVGTMDGVETERADGQFHLKTDAAKTDKIVKEVKIVKNVKK